VGGQRHAPADLALGKIPGTHCTRGLGGRRAGMNGYGEEQTSALRLMV